ncbi:MAG: hypothetical protein IPM02_26070 [Betaproteobacteria bacterium]|nr:hypothetical protein [Betaproteobacteria bacterium]
MRSRAANRSFTLTPNSGYQVASVTVDGSSVGAVSKLHLPNVTANHTIAATLSVIPPTPFTITASAGANGSISPSGNVAVTSGANRSFTITPNSGYQISSVVVDGVAQGAIASYTFTNVTANHTIAASFSTATPPGEVPGLVTHLKFDNDATDSAGRQ